MLENEREKQIVSFQCESATTHRLAELARRGERSLSGEIRLAVREHLERSDVAGSVPSSRLANPDVSAAGSSSAPAAPLGEAAR
jgi:ribbon-helix-helix CopG family protein